MAAQGSRRRPFFLPGEELSTADPSRVARWSRVYAVLVDMGERGLLPDRSRLPELHLRLRYWTSRRRYLELRRSLRPLPGEDRNTPDVEEARHWSTVHTALVELARDLLGPDALQVRLLRTRSRYWQYRLRHLELLRFRDMGGPPLWVITGGARSVRESDDPTEAPVDAARLHHRSSTS